MKNFTNIPGESWIESIERFGVVFRTEPMSSYLQEDQFISAGKLHDILVKTPRQFLYGWRNPEEETDALIEGTAFHTAILEPTLFDKNYAVMLKKNRPNPDKDFRDSANKKYRDHIIALAELQGRKMITEDVFDMVMGMRDALMMNEAAHAILTQRGVTELSIYTTIEWNGKKYYVKIRPDFVSLQKPFYLDLKKARNADPGKNGFPKDAYNYGYDIKVSLYFDILHTHWAELLRFMGADDMKEELRRALIIAVEGEPPYNSTVFNVTNDVLATGRYRYNQALARFAECLESGEWPGYEMYAEPENKGIVNLELPAYASQEIVL